MKVKNNIETTIMTNSYEMPRIFMRQCDIPVHQSDDDFLREAARLDNNNERMPAERAFRLCRSLRVALREIETLAGRLAGAVSAKDWNALLQQMQSNLPTEGEVTLYIALQFQQLGAAARSAYRYALAAFRSAFIGERREFISQELTVYNIV